MKAITAVFTALLLSACGPQSGSPEQGASEGTETETQHAGMGATIDPGRPDRSFAELMIPHHRGAMEMAEAELRLGKDPELRALATKIIADQQCEVAQLEAWLATPSAQAGKR